RRRRRTYQPEDRPTLPPPRSGAPAAIEVLLQQRIDLQFRGQPVVELVAGNEAALLRPEIGRFGDHPIAILAGHELLGHLRFRRCGVGQSRLCTRGPANGSRLPCAPSHDTACLSTRCDFPVHHVESPPLLSRGYARTPSIPST